MARSPAHLCNRLALAGVDVLTDLLHRSRARTAVVRQLVQRPPWSMTFADGPPLAVVAALGGRASIRPADGDPVDLAAGDIAEQARGHMHHRDGAASAACCITSRACP